MATEALAAAIRAIAAHHELSAGETHAAFGDVMRGEASPTQIAALLIGLRARGETADEVAGAVRALRDAMNRVDVPDPASLVDTCGTGGGSFATFNISTAAAFVAAGAGVRIAKHGNRSFTSRCGSADVLEALGIAIELPLDALPGVLAKAGMMFMFAPLMHPAMRHVGPVRRELGVPTVMNIVGPLANPAGVRRQVVGVADAARLPLVAGALAQLGTVHALVVHGEPGLDELSPIGATTVLEVRGSAVDSWTLDPRSHGMGRGTVEDLAGDDPAGNAAVIEAVLGGRGAPGARDAVVLNAAAAVYVSGAANEFASAVALANSAIDSGAAHGVLERLRRAAPAPVRG